MITLKHFLRHGFVESFKNLVNCLKAYGRILGFNKGVTTKIHPPLGYTQVFYDGFTSKLNRNNWRYGQPWGDFHPGSLHQYYDTDGTLSYVSPSGLILELRKIPKSYKKSEIPEWRKSPSMPEEFTIPVGVGFVSSKDSWRYGWFEALIKLPNGQSYWPAFWLTGENGWPPEIDILEAYSEIGPSYEGKLLFNKFFKKKDVKIQPNLHYGKIELNNKRDYGSYNAPVHLCTERVVQYVCHWESDFIKIYYDGILVMETRNQEVLKWFNEKYKRMYVCLNHGLHQDHTENPKESCMIVRSFRVWQKT